MAKPLIWTHPLIHKVATAGIYNDSYTDIRDQWSTGELVEALRHIDFRRRLDEYHHEEAKRKQKP